MIYLIYAWYYVLFGSCIMSIGWCFVCTCSPQSIHWVNHVALHITMETWFSSFSGKVKVTSECIFIKLKNILHLVNIINLQSTVFVQYVSIHSCWDHAPGSALFIRCRVANEMFMFWFHATAYWLRSVTLSNIYKCSNGFSRNGYKIVPSQKVK